MFGEDIFSRGSSTGFGGSHSQFSSANPFSNTQGTMHSNPYEGVFQNHWRGTSASDFRASQDDNLFSDFDETFFAMHQRGPRKSTKIVNEQVKTKTFNRNGLKIKKIDRIVTYADGREEVLSNEEVVGKAD